MPQFDVVTYHLLIIYTAYACILFYSYCTRYLIPRVVEILKMRKKVEEKRILLEKIQKNARARGYYLAALKAGLARR